MKNRFYGWRLALFFLVLLHPSGLLAEGAYDSGNNTPRTAEELLVCIRDFLANPNVDGVAFVEKIIGVSKADWGVPSDKRTGFTQDPYVRWERYYGSQLKQPLSAPYRISSFGLDESAQRLMYIDFTFFRERKFANVDYYYLLELTPALVQNILGPPDELHVSSPTRGGSSVGHYYVSYTYRRGKYELRIPFSAKGDNQLMEERMAHSGEQMWAERARRKLFENHKDFLAITMLLSRKK